MYSCARLSLLFLGFLLVSLYQQVESSLLGYVDLSEPTSVWSTLNICPTGLTNDQNTRKKLLSVVGKGSGLSFTVQIAEGASKIELDKSHTVNVQGDEVSVFQFIPPQGISDKQLDITVTSQSKVAAYLKVSQNCKEVDFQKDLEIIDYKKESLRLSFATKGRITLSSVSIPPLTDSFSKWFIGIGLNNLSGDVKLSESKNVTLKLTRSFDYNYAKPVSALFLASLLGGILVSIVACFIFEESLTKVNLGKGKQGNSADLKTLVCGMWEVIRYQWFFQGPKPYSSITGIVAAVLMIGASQFVFGKWDTMIKEGSRDNCYYNDLCYRVLYYDIPFNLMISNLTYIVHGLILVVWVLILETKVKLRCKSIAANFQGPRLPEHSLSYPETNIHHLEGGIPKPENPIETEERKKEEKKATKKRYCFSIGYAFSWGLVFEGLFSTLYHFCPSRFTFQFDSAFMFIIAGLTALLLYNGIEQNRCPSSGNVKYLIGAFNFSLFFIVSLFIFNYFGALVNSDSGLNEVMQWFFFIFSIILWFVMINWAFPEFFKFYICEKVLGDDFEGNAVAWQVVPYVLMLNFILLMLLVRRQLFLYTCITYSVFAILVEARPWGKLCECERVACVKNIFKGLFILLTLIILVTAFTVSKSLPTANKTSSPENFRDQNKECDILGFFDRHGLGHFLSSFALLMSAFVVMFISSEPEQSSQAKKRENNEPEAQRKKRV